MTELAIRTQVFTQLGKVADERGNKIDELIEQILCQFLRREARRTIQREAESFRAMHADLLTQYPSQYVAIHQGLLVDHDQSQLALLSRIEKQYPDTPVLVRQVRPKIEKVYTIRSPRFAYD